MAAEPESKPATSFATATMMLPPSAIRIVSGYALWSSHLSATFERRCGRLRNASSAQASMVFSVFTAKAPLTNLRRRARMTLFPAHRCLDLNVGADDRPRVKRWPATAIPAPILASMTELLAALRSSGSAALLSRVRALPQNEIVYPEGVTTAKPRVKPLECGSKSCPTPRGLR